MSRARGLERRLGQWMRARLPAALAEFVMFGLKMGWAALYGGAMLGALIASHLLWQEGWPIHRYDALFAFAIALQALFLALGLESWREVKVILLFHLTGTLMELFKTEMGSWAYPEDAIFRIGGVPLFSGFMYGGVGSFIARAIRSFDMRFAPYPPYWVSVALGAAIYVNFFTHHFGPDLRYVLIAATLLLFWRTRIAFRPARRIYAMPLPIAAGLTALFLWIAENVGTATRSWLYAGQSSGDLVSFAKIGSWYLLLYVSFATVTLVTRDALERRA